MAARPRDFRRFNTSYASRHGERLFYEGALRSARNLRLWLGGGPADDECPDQLPRMHRTM